MATTLSATLAEEATPAAAAAAQAPSSGVDALLFSDARKERNRTLVPEPPNKPYAFKHHPDHWEWVDDATGGCWLPVLTTFHISPGVNGTRATKKGLDLRLSKGSIEASGFTLLHSNEVITRTRTTRGGWFYHERWMTPRIIGRRVTWSCDHEAANHWRRSLVANGTIEAPAEEALQQHRRVQTKLVHRLSQRIHEPSTSLRYQREIKKLQAMEAMAAADVVAAIRKTLMEAPDAD